VSVRLGAAAALLIVAAGCAGLFLSACAAGAEQGPGSPGSGQVSAPEVPEMDRNAPPDFQTATFGFG
jgi:hypothetical protein